MVIQHNMAAMNTNRQLGISVGAAAKSTEKLSSGYRINRAGDDAAGLAISEKMRSQIRGLDRASANSQDGISLIQTAEGALNETQSILQRMRELAVQAANGTNTDSDRNEIQKEVNQLTSEINRIANTTEFNTMKLLKGNTNKAEIGGVDSETLKAGETGVAGGTLENFKVDQNSTVAKESTATVTANSSEATGSLKTDSLDEATKGIQGEYGSTTVGGITFSTNSKTDTQNGKTIEIFRMADDNGANPPAANKEGIVTKGGGNTIVIALKESTIDNLDNVQELMSIIENLGAGDATTTAAVGGGSAVGTAFSTYNLDLTLPKDENTGKPVQDFLPDTVGNSVTGNIQGGKIETQGIYEFDIDKLFKEADDSIVIGKEKFVFKENGKDNPAAGEIGLGDSHSMGTFSLKGKATTAGGTVSMTVGAAALSHTVVAGDTAETILEDLKTQAEAANAYVLYNKEAGSLTVVAKATGATTYTKAAAAGTTGLTLSDEGGFTGVAFSSPPTDAEKMQAQKQNLAAAIALNANLSKNYFVNENVTSDTAKIQLVERKGSGGAGKELDKSLTVLGGGENDSIVIKNPLGMNGIIFELVDDKLGTNTHKGSSDGTAANDYTSNVGTNANVIIGQDSTNKDKFYINLGNTTNGNTAAKIQQALRDFVKGGNITLSDGTVADFKDLTVEAQGKWDDNTTFESNLNKTFTATAGGVEEKKGTYSFDATTLFTDGDEVTIAGKKFIAKSKNADISKGEFDISSTDRTTQALRLKEAIAADSDIAEKYNVTANNTKITLTEKKASGTDMKETDIGVINLGVQGQYKIDELELQKDGASITIDGQKIDFSSKNAHVGYADGTAIKVTDTVEDQKTALVAAINKNAELSKKYEASIGDDGSLMLTQKVGSDNAPEITTTSSTKGTFDVTFQVGANTGQSMTIAIGDNRANALGVAGDGTEESIMADNGATAYYTKTENVTDGTTNDNIEYALDVTSFEKATAAIGVIDDALSSISAQRSQLGAYQNRLEHTIANLDNTSENLQSSESRIRDVDMAKEMTNFSKNNILQQAAQSMLAQANQSTQGVLTLLR